MAGPAIRTYHLSRVLARHMPAKVAMPSYAKGDLTSDGVEFHRYDLDDWSTLAPLVAESSVCIAQGDIVNLFPEIARLPTALVIDGYTPYLAEFLATWSFRPISEQFPLWQTRMYALNPQFTAGDFYICASERQRDWWLGLLEAHGRVNPVTLADDPSLRRLLDVVPYGLRSDPIRPTRRVVRGVWPGIGESDKVLLWGGGLWPWLDPLTAIRAVAQVWQQRQDVRLIFPGTRHPNPTVNGMPTHTEAAKALAADLDLAGRAVFFGDWVPYEDWDNVLSESDVALSLHFDTLETRLAFRSRLFDYIRAGVPSLVSRGDATAEIVEQHNLGLTVPIADVNAVSQTLITLLEEPRATRAAHFDAARNFFTWERAAEPLVRFCQVPHRAPDRAAFGKTLGNPATVALVEQLAQARKTIDAYESGKFMRLMRAFDQIKRRIFSPASQEGAKRA